MNHQSTILGVCRRVRVAVEINGQFRNRYVFVQQTADDTDQTMIEKARTVFVGRYSERNRIVAIDVNCPQ